ncbi:hypothetical protein C900_02129 [Fulvivirga imtechensis AK7]|uniref:Exported 24-amino acid repeat protein n=1 Tax=Fulvivirga imtechensis AK7 TaxID=1237149 RepID=L8JSR2_9BACT|nr:hypothetical protein [Fulvivirga imtechensis]ELR71890.1 hypothetical protein C900_02129 [Fulvivirga imtechensis AK7]
MQKGIVCKLTGDVATFEYSCNDFIKDEIEAAYQEEQKTTPVQEAKPIEIIEQLDADTIERLRETQDMLFALIGGLAAALLGAVLWATITVATNYQIGFMAIGVGLIVGFGVRFFGSGIDKTYGIIGAIYALLGCLLGNLFTQVWFLAEYQSIGLFDAFKLLNTNLLVAIFEETFSPIDLIFYGIAVAEGYNFAFRKLSFEELALLKKSPEFIPYPANHKLRTPLVAVIFVGLSGLFFGLRGGVNGLQTYYYESGAKMSEGELVDGVVNGPWTYYDENENITLKGNYENGLENGKWTWYEGSIMTKEGHYSTGIPHGVWINYYSNGFVADSGAYNNGRKDGWWIIRHESGRLAGRGKFLRDKLTGNWDYFYENGKRSSEESYDKGVLSGKTTYYYDNGQKSRELEYHDEKQRIINCWSPTGEILVAEGNGIFNTYFSNNKIAQTGTVKDGKKIGVWKIFHDNGTLQAEGEFDEEEIFVIDKYWDDTGNIVIKNGTGNVTNFGIENGLYQEGKLIKGYRQGLWHTYNTNSALLIEANYKNGRFHGTYKGYFPSGTLNIEGYYENGKQSGIWYWYYENGLLESSINFANGKKDGVQEFYNELGIKIREEVYKAGELVEENITSL